MFIIQKLYTSGEKFKEAGNFLEKSLGKEGAYNTPKPHQGVRNMKKRKGQADLQKSLTYSLVDRFGLMGDRGYRGCEYVEVCKSKEQKGIRQVKKRDYLTCLPLWLRYRL
jgi:hypothetical protein